MSALAFALVDVVMRQRAAQARKSCGFSEHAERRWMQRVREVGAWRGVWQVLP